MEKAIFFNKLDDFKKIKITPKYSRVYFGTEFCQKLIPARQSVEYLLNCTKKIKVAFTFVTPFVTDKGLERLRDIFLLLKKEQDLIEVVVNDWGVLRLINQEFRQLKPVLGRLMFRLKRDPRIPTLINETQKSVRFKDASGNTVVVLPKRIPEALKEAYCKTNIDFDEVSEFLLSNRINRVEVDNLLQGLSLDLPKKISGSVYFPFGYLTVTRYCPVSVNSHGKTRIGKCNRECQKYFWKMRSSCIPKILYRKGNAQFYKNSKLSIKQWEEMGINRLIYEFSLPN
jgi:glycosyltransferase involved in cell wall biosynthesis